MTWGLAIVTLAYAAAMALLIVPILRSRDWRLHGLVLVLAYGALFALWLIGQRTLFWAIPISLVLAAALSALVVRLRGRRARGLAVLGVLCALAAVKLLGDRVVESGWRDVDGFIDCWPSCNRAHLVGSLLYYWPAIVALTVLLVLAVTAVLERRPDGGLRAATR